MTVTNVHKDKAALTMTMTAEFAAPVSRVWQLWENPRNLERWWGPPEYPATFVDHDLTVGSIITYFMTGPEGDKHRGWWRVLAVEPPHLLEFEDGFADEDFKPNADLPSMTARVSIDVLPDGGTRMAIVTRFPSLQAMEDVLAMGAEEGMVAAMGQIDDVLASLEHIS